jgi:hypothetical protein
LKRDGTIGVPSENPFSLGVLILFERKMLAALQSLVCQQLAQHDLHNVRHIFVVMRMLSL